MPMFDARFAQGSSYLVTPAQVATFYDCVPAVTTWCSNPLDLDAGLRFQLQGHLSDMCFYYW